MFNVSPEFWYTFAHELGHTFGGRHTFKDGQGTTGGILDYGNPVYQNQFQFNTKYSRREMCGYLAYMKQEVDSGGFQAAKVCYRARGSASNGLPNIQASRSDPAFTYGVKFDSRVFTSGVLDRFSSFQPPCRVPDGREGFCVKQAFAKSQCVSFWQGVTASVVNAGCRTRRNYQCCVLGGAPVAICQTGGRSGACLPASQCPSGGGASSVCTGGTQCCPAQQVAPPQSGPAVSTAHCRYFQCPPGMVQNNVSCPGSNVGACNVARCCA
jgi:hypothetical protein